MRVVVAVGFVDKDWHTRIKGSVVDIDEAYATILIEQGKVVVEDEPVVDMIDTPKGEKTKSTKRKASKKNAGKTV